MITEPAPTSQEQARTFRSSRRYAMFWFFMGVALVCLGVFRMLYIRRDAFGYLDLAFGTIWLGVAWHRWSRAR